jgi:hypothetical protein
VAHRSIGRTRISANHQLTIPQGPFETAELQRRRSPSRRSRGSRTTHAHPTGRVLRDAPRPAQPRISERRIEDRRLEPGWPDASPRGHLDRGLVFWTRGRNRLCR